jgi:nucleoside-diphosphate-sugar epimerase
MPDAGVRTAFVTGAAGFIGRELIKVLVGLGLQVFGLVDPTETAPDILRAGATIVTGDLLVPGRWQDEAAAHWVFHIPPSGAPARRVTSGPIDRFARARVAVDQHLLDALATGTTRRIVYVADAGLYGPTGSRAITEDEPPASSEQGRALAPTLDRLDGYVIAGLPIITALPGCVYGNGSWFRERIVDPVMAGRRVLQFGTAGPWVSPIHVHDCARALVHLAEHGEVGNRYFLVNNEPVRMNELARAFARLARRPLRVWRIPTRAARLVAGSRFADCVRSDAAFANIRLRGIGFRFRYPTLELGIEQILGALHE